LTGPLQGIRVLDLTRARAGPTCTRQLSDFGADVVHVVPPRGADFLGNSDAANLHRNKRSVALDLHHPDGVAAFLRLADRADVLVENMRPAVKHRLGIGPDVLMGRNSRLVYASLSGFGQTGPYADRPGLDQVAQGMGGLMSVTGPPGSGPWRVGIAISDTASGTFLTQGVLAALFARERTGRGQWVSTSLLEAMVNVMDFQACRWLTDGVVPGQEGNDHPTIFPMGAYRCADGWINVAGAMALERFLDVIGGRELLDDRRFTDADSRRANRDAFNDACEALLSANTVDHWVEQLNAASIAAGPVYAIDEVFADAQVEHLALEQVVDDGGRPVHVLRHPVTLSDTPASIRSGVAAGGMHTREVLAEAGYDDAEIDALLASGAARQANSS
jgi:crotonobetainyl-CoA:carnitine CoA-transferase CaiB-like acyl-CoA transferase